MLGVEPKQFQKGKLKEKPATGMSWDGRYPQNQDQRDPRGDESFTGMCPLVLLAVEASSRETQGNGQAESTELILYQVVQLSAGESNVALFQRWESLPSWEQGQRK